MRCWGLERAPDGVSWARGTLVVALTDDKAARQHHLREAWRAATWDDWRARGLRKEAHLARAAQASWHPRVGDAVRKLIQHSDIGQHVLAVVSGATFSEARLVATRNREERLKNRKRKRRAALPQASAAGDRPDLEQEGHSDGSESSAEGGVRSDDEAIPNCECGIPEPPTLRHLFWRCTHHDHLR
eukprot:6316701-Alexandrium_andersonii.AAC.1